MNTMSLAQEIQRWLLSSTWRSLARTRVIGLAALLGPIARDGVV